MNTQPFVYRLFVCLALFGLLLSACAPAATPATEKLEAPQAVAARPLHTVQVEAQTEKEVEAPVSAGPAAQPAATQDASFSTPLPTASAAIEKPAEPVPPIVASPPPVDNYFQYYGLNPFEDPREDRLSTFALDVDTASYSVARRYVMDGNLPPVESVRVEEFVNYFDAGYATPSDVAFAIYADGAPSPFHFDGSYMLRFGVQGYQVPEAERKPAALTFVIDVSGSMDMENRLGLVKQSLQLLVERLRPTDTVAIVVYGSEARLALNPTSGEDRNRILDVIYSLRTEGATNAEAGLRLGYQLAYQAYRPGAINRVILCSDGVANVGVTGPDAILEQIRGYADTGITLTSVGFGMGNFNDVLMEQLADNGDGAYAYVDTLDEAERLFVDDLTSTLQAIAMDAKVQVDFNPDVVSRYRLIGYENRDVADQDFRNDYVDAGEIGAGHSAAALYAVILHPGAQGRIATVQLRWQDPDSLAVHEINGNFNTWDLSPSFESASPRYQLAVVVAQYAEQLRLSPWAVDSSIGQILQHAVRLAGLLPGDSEVSEFASLVSRASQIRALTQR
ncbi:MAG: von Willebrand factor type A domain-containing protein [Anaerolineales bacterium]|nr:von Willebrand factor type A domain-containing protein [Anaerolineales bacterium]